MAPVYLQLLWGQDFISLLEIDFALGRCSNSCDSLVRGVQSNQVAGGVWDCRFQSGSLILL